MEIGVVQLVPMFACENFSEAQIYAGPPIQRSRGDRSAPGTGTPQIRPDENTDEREEVMPMIRQWSAAKARTELASAC